MSQRFDFAVIGAGSAGLVAAVAAANFGQKVVLFESGRMGGECLNTGCVPSKALLAAAKSAAACRQAARFGVFAEPRIDADAVRAHVRRVIDTIAPHDSQERMESLGITVVRAPARFRDAATLEAAGRHYTARRIVIATGSRPAFPAIPGLAGTPFLTNESLFDLAVLPQHLIVIGGGPIGVEMAQAHRRLGSDVTILEAAGLLGRDDPELTRVVVDRLMEEGVSIRDKTTIASISQSARGFDVRLGDGTVVAGSHLLVAAGRRPNTDNLNLATAAVSFTPKGITVDKRLRTTNPRVYAIGDCNGGPQFTHAAGHQAGLVIRHALFRLPVDAAKVVMPRVTYSDPELAQAGLTEAEARAQLGDAVTVLRRPFATNDRAVAEADTQGLVKIVAGRRGRILGVGIVGAQAGDLIQPWLVAMNNGLSLRAMLATLPPYPTRGEAGRQAALDYFGGFASNPWVRHVIEVLGRFG